jgi:hypothetical protein
MTPLTKMLLAASFVAGNPAQGATENREISALFH